jgi:hypothetical protein
MEKPSEIGAEDMIKDLLIGYIKNRFLQNLLHSIEREGSLRNVLYRISSILVEVEFPVVNGSFQF